MIIIKTGTDLGRIILRDIDNFIGQKLDGNYFHRADLSNFNFTKTEFKNVELRNAFLDGTMCMETKFIKCMLIMTSFKNAYFQDAVFIDSKLNHAEFINSCLISCIFKDNRYSKEYDLNLEFTNCNLYKSQFENNSFVKSIFKNSNLSKTVFTDNDLSKSQFNNSNLENCIFKNNNLSECSFVNSNIKNVNFEKCELRDVDFSGAIYNSHTNFSEIFSESNLEKMIYVD